MVLAMAAEGVGDAQTADRGEEHRVALGGALEAGAQFAEGLVVDGIGLGDRHDLRLLGDAGAVGDQLFAHGAVIGDRILRGAVDQMEEDAAALDVAQEARAEAGAFAGAFDEAGEVGDDELAAVDGGDAEAGVEEW